MLCSSIFGMFQTFLFLSWYILCDLVGHPQLQYFPIINLINIVLLVLLDQLFSKLELLHLIISYLAHVQTKDLTFELLKVIFTNLGRGYPAYKSSLSCFDSFILR